MLQKKPIIHPTAEVDPTAYIHPNTRIGKYSKVGPHCTIGYDGFEFHRDARGKPHQVEHLGAVVIGDYVVIRANTCIVRGVGKGDITVIGDHTKIDNLVHIAHNCHIGKRNLIVAGTVFGGSVTCGNDNFFGIKCLLKPWVKIGSYNLIGMGAVVISDIENHEVWAGNPARKLRDNEFFKNRKERALRKRRG